MDAAQVVTEEIVDRFSGLTFSEACEMLFGECKSNAPSSEGFQNMIDYIRTVHETMDLEFSCEAYWNPGTISGGHEVFPQGLGSSFNIIPVVLDEKYLQDMIEKIGALEAATTQYRVTHERVTNHGRPRSSGSGNGTIDTRLLTRSVNTVPVFSATSADDEEDDFI